MTSDAETRTRAAIYCRISKDDTGKRAGVDRQEGECRELAARLGWDVDRLFVDNSISAYSGRKRPGYLELLAAIEAGHIDAVLAWHPDRLHRAPIELEHFIDLSDKHHVVTHSVQSGLWDLSTPSGRMVARQLGAVARYESENRSARVKAAKRANAAAGRLSGGASSWGFDSSGNVHDEQAAEIRKAAASLVSGVSLRQICKDMNQRGVKTVTGKPWASGHLGRALLRPRLAGISTHLGNEVGTGFWTPILDMETHLAVAAILRDPSRCTGGSGRRGGPVPSALGTGLYVCSACELPRLRIGQSGGRDPAYRCGGMDLPGLDDDVKHVTRRAEPLDLFVEAAILRRLNHPGIVEAAVRAAEATEDEGTQELRAEQARIRVAQNALAATLRANPGSLDLIESVTASAAELTRRDEQITASLARSGRRSALRDLMGVTDVDRAWSEMTMGTKRAILAEVVTVTVLPARSGRMPDGGYFDTEAVSLDFKV